MYLVFLFLLVLIFLARFNFFRIPKKGILVLLYHRIDDRPTHTALDKFSVPLDRFEWQIEYLKRKGFESIKPQQIEEIKNKKLYLKKKYILITFDDGYKDNVEAAKVLKKHGFSGLFFVSTALIGKTYNGVEMMDFNDLERLKRMGMVIGSHSHEHVKLAFLDKKEIERQLEVSLSILSRVQKTVEDFAYPYGNFNTDVIDVLKRRGVKRGYIIGQRIFDPEVESQFKIPRAIIRKDTNKIDFYLIISRGRSKF